QGIAFHAMAIPLQSFNYLPGVDDRPREEAIADCVDYAASQKDVDIIIVQSSSSFGTVEGFPVVREAIRRAVGEGKNVVIPAGEMSTELFDEALDDTGSIIVGALAQDGMMAYYSNYGPRVTISAFGEQVRTLVGPTIQIDFFGG